MFDRLKPIEDSINKSNDSCKKYFSEIDQVYEYFSKAFDESVIDGKVLIDFKQEKDLKVFLNRYELANSVDAIEKMRYNISFQMVSDLFQDWLQKTKNEQQKEVLKKCSNAMSDIFFINFNLEKNIKYAIAERHTIKDQLSLFQKKAYELAKENEALKKEIEFISK
jgi:hypothetical protein